MRKLLINNRLIIISVMVFFLGIFVYEYNRFIGIILILISLFLFILFFKEKIKLEIITTLVTIILAITGYYFTSMENRIQSERQLFQEKNLALWQDRKKLFYDFIDFLDKEIFFNNKIDILKENDNFHELNELKLEKERIAREFNVYRDKLFLIMDTNFLNKIYNQYTADGKISGILRYYILRDIRKEMLKYTLDKDTEIKESDIPYYSLSVLDEYINKNTKFKDFDEFHKVYPYVEKGDKTNTYKVLPQLKIE